MRDHQISQVMQRFEININHFPRVSTALNEGDHIPLAPLRPPGEYKKH